jgi:DNA repair protein RadC
MEKQIDFLSDVSGADNMESVYKEDAAFELGFLDEYSRFETEPDKNYFLPREKFLRDGKETLSDIELLSLILNTGIAGKNVRKLSLEVLKKINSKCNTPSIADLCLIKGLGKKKAVLVLSVLEFGRRRWAVKGTKIKTPENAYKLIQHYACSPQENFIVMTLNGAHEVIDTRVVFVGTLNSSLVHPREVFASVISDRACAVLVAHNHPSGMLTASENDIAATISLQKAAGILRISFIDHIIFNENSFYSFRRDGKLGEQFFDNEFD